MAMRLFTFWVDFGVLWGSFCGLGEPQELWLAGIRVANWFLAGWQLAELLLEAIWQLAGPAKAGYLGCRDWLGEDPWLGFSVEKLSLARLLSECPLRSCP